MTELTGADSTQQQNLPSRMAITPIQIGVESDKKARAAVTLRFAPRSASRSSGCRTRHRSLGNRSQTRLALAFLPILGRTAHGTHVLAQRRYTGWLYLGVLTSRKRSQPKHCQRLVVQKGIIMFKASSRVAHNPIRPLPAVHATYFVCTQVSPASTA